MSKLPIVARILLGLAFFVFGLNNFLHFMPTPPMTGRPAEFMGGLVASGYMFPLLGITEMAAGVMLLSGRFVPLGLTLLAPILVNILGYHLALAPASIGMGAFFTVLEIYLAWAYRDAFRPMLAATAKPTTK